jgi:hypothetical protein
MEGLRERERTNLWRTLSQWGWNYKVSKPLRGRRERLSTTAEVDGKLVGLYCTLFSSVGTLMQVSTEDINVPLTWWEELPPTPTEAKALVDDVRRGRVHGVRKRVLGLSN